MSKRVSLLATIDRPGPVRPVTRADMARAYRLAKSKRIKSRAALQMAVGRLMDAVGAAGRK